MRNYLFLNATSGQGAAARRWARLEPVARSIFPDLTVVTGSRAEEMQSAVREIATNGAPSTVIAGGGDGTSHLVVNGLLDARPGHQTAMGWLPIGSGNDLARAIGLPIRQPDCLLAYRERYRGAIDAGRIAFTSPDGKRIHRWFGNSLTLGLTVEAVRIVARRGKSMGGRAGYFLAAIEAVARHTSSSYQLTIDGESRQVDRCHLISITNGPTFGAGMKVSPSASLTDGQLDLVWLAGLSRPWILSLLPQVYSGGHLGHSAVHSRKIRSIWVAGDQPIAFEADGELVEGRLPLTIEVVPAGLPVVLPGTEPPAPQPS